MQQPFYGTSLLACTRRPLQPHFSFFFRPYINTLIGGFLSVCVCVCWLRFFAFFELRRCNITSTVHAYSHAPADRFNSIFRFFSNSYQYSNWRFSVCLSVCAH